MKSKILTSHCQLIIKMLKFQCNCIELFLIKCVFINEIYLKICKSVFYENKSIFL